MSKFIHLHNHTVYSILDGISRPSDMIKKAKECGMPAVARTDHGNLSNSISFYRDCYAEGIKAICGQEYYLAPDSHLNRDYSTKAKAQEEAEESGDLSYSAYHLTVLAKNRIGFDNLQKLSTIGYRLGFYRKPRIDLDLLTQYKEGLIILSGCMASMTSRLICSGQEDKAIELIDRERAIFGDNNFFIEIMNHAIGPEEDKLNEVLMHIAKTKGIGLVLSNDSHYTNKEDAYAQEVSLCIGTNKTVHDPKHFRFNGSGYWFKSPEEMAEVAKVAGFPEESLSNTVLVGNMIEDYGFKLTSKKNPFQVPLFRNQDGKPLSPESCHNLLETKVWSGLVERGLADKEIYQKRILEELDLIKRKNFSSYFLIIADIVDFMRKSNMPVGVGRGSSLGALVCYCLYITGLDPIVFDLPFGRFINEGRKDLPDIDTDISQARRKEVIDYIVNKYGKDRVAQIVTFQPMAAKGSLDNVGRALGVPSSTRRLASHLIGEVDKDDKLEEIVNNNHKVKEIVDQVPDWLKISSCLEGNNKNLGAHAAGIVICNEPIGNQVPLIRDSKEGYLVTQYDMNDLQELGLLKLDMLGLKTLDLVYNTINMVRDRHGVNLDLHKIPLDDKATYDYIATGKYVSVFQYDSSGIRNTAKQLRPEKFEHLVATNCLYRPGCMKKDSGTGGKSILENYIERRHGREDIEVWHEDLREIFSKTLGLSLYQEEIMKMSQIIGGFTETEADEFRHSIGKKNVAEFTKASTKLISGGLKRGYSQEFLDSLIEKIKGCARYLWNRSHSVAYSYISYVTAFLEVHFPFEYFTTLLNVNLDDNKELKTLLSAILQRGIKILPPHINNSKSEFYTDGTNIYMGLFSVRQTGDIALKVLMDDRDSKGPYKDFLDFCMRMGPYGKVNKLVKDNLIKAGAFSWDKSINDHSKLENTRLIQEIFLKFEDKVSVEEIRKLTEARIVTNYAEFTDQERLNHERSVLNFYISSHPVSQYLPLFTLFPQMNFIVPSELQNQDIGSHVVMFGVVESREMATTKKGDPYLRLKVGDHMGSADIMVWSPLATIAYNKLTDQSLVFISGIIKDDKFRVGEVQLNVNAVVPLVTPGLPITSFYAPDQIIANRVITILGAEAVSISEPVRYMGSVAILKNVAYIEPKHFDQLKLYNVNYQLNI